MFQNLAPDTLEELADALLEAESSRSLLQRLEEILDQFGALPAVLYLADRDARVFYCAAAFRTGRDLPDIPFDQALESHQLVLRSRREPVGLLVVPQGFDGEGVRRVGSILGPALSHLQRQEATSRDLLLAREQISHLIAAGDLLRHLDVDVLLVQILETVMTAVRAEVGAVVTPNETGALTARVTWGLREDHIDNLRLSDGRKLVTTVFENSQTLCLDEAQVAERIDRAALGANLNGLLALPLTTRGSNKGVVLLANPAETFGHAQQRLAETVCSLAAIALDNALLVKAMVEGERLKQEMDLARSVQEGMFPKQGLVSRTMVVEGTSHPCSETGGDYFTFHEAQGRVVGMIGDVSGHGLGAALYTTMAHVLVQQQFRACTPLEPTFRLLNDGLYHTHSGRFMTAALVEFDATTGAFSYVSAGHNPILWYHRGEIRWLESSGFPLGIMDQGDWPLSTGTMTLEPGDLLLLYTDGVTEAATKAGECYSEERLGQQVAAAMAEGLSPTALMQRISADVDAWCGSTMHEDDITMVAFQRMT